MSGYFLIGIYSAFSLFTLLVYKSVLIISFLAFKTLDFALKLTHLELIRLFSTQEGPSGLDITGN